MANKFMILGILILTFGVSSESLAYKKASRCGKTTLQIKDCSLETFGYRLHFLDGKILIHNGIWRSIQDFPIAGDTIEWSDIRVYQLIGRRFISFQIWGKPEGLTSVQNLNWYIYEIKDRKIELHLQQIVQKRQKNDEASLTGVYSFDPKDQFGLKVVKNKVMWFHKGDTEILK